MKNHPFYLVGFSCLIIIGLFVVFGVLKIMQYLNFKKTLEKSRLMTYEECIAESSLTKGNIISICTINGNDSRISVWRNGEETVPNENYQYEIGSVTKTFTALLFYKTISEVDINYRDGILNLDGSKISIKNIMSHRSGLPNFHNPLLLSLKALSGNTLRDIPPAALMKYKDKVSVIPSPFRYSSTAFSLLGHLTGELKGEDYEKLMECILIDLGMKNTFSGKGKGNLKNYSRMNYNDGYAPAGSLVSDIRDMEIYLRHLINSDRHYILECLKIIGETDVKNDTYRYLGSSMTHTASSWMYDGNHGFYWHNGGTDHFNSYVAFDTVNKKGIVVLSSVNYLKSLPATVIGIKYMTDSTVK